MKKFIVTLTEEERKFLTELTSKGIDSARIMYEPSGFNTRSQALNAANMYAVSIERTKVLIVTSPEHVFRSVKCFKKAGFDEVYGLPAIEQPGDEDSLHDRKSRKRMRDSAVILKNAGN